jgi:hypothetical protein
MIVVLVTFVTFGGSSGICKTVVNYEVLFEKCLVLCLKDILNVGSFLVLIRKVTKYERICTFFPTHCCYSRCFESISCMSDPGPSWTRLMYLQVLTLSRPDCLYCILLLSVRAIYCRGPPPQGGGGMVGKPCKGAA